MMAFAVLRKGHPKIMVALASPPISKTTKSARYIGLSHSYTNIFKNSNGVAK
jgi:hypothetical protein